MLARWGRHEDYRWFLVNDVTGDMLPTQWRHPCHSWLHDSTHHVTLPRHTKRTQQHDDVIKMETFSTLLALCAGNSPVPVNSPHKGQWRGALMFSLICARINDWANREAGDLRRYRGHYDVIVMKISRVAVPRFTLNVRCLNPYKHTQRARTGPVRCWQHLVDSSQTYDGFLCGFSFVGVNTSLRNANCLIALWEFSSITVFIPLSS